MELAEALGIPRSALKDPDRYDITGVLAEGGMGRLFVGTDTRLKREIVVKIILPDQNRTEISNRFYREAQAIAMLDHPAIVRVYDYSGADSAIQFMVMERLKGVDLQRLVDVEMVPEAVVLAIAYELSQAFAQLHAAGLLHRDVKPSNIMVEPNGRVVLLDFGLVKGTQQQGGRDTFVASSTRIAGTAVFMSPEQVRGEPLDLRTDLFSLGGVLYFALSQVFAFNASSLSEVARMIVRGQRHPIADLVDVQPGTAEIVERLMANKRDERFPSGEALAKAIGPELQKLGVFAPQKTIAEWLATIDTTAMHTRPRPVSSGSVLTSPDPTEPGDNVTRIQPVTMVQTATAPRLEPKSGRTKWLVAISILAATLVVAFAVGRSRDRTRSVAPAAPALPLPAPAPAPPEPIAAELPRPAPDATVAPVPNDPPKKAQSARVSFSVDPWGDITVDGRFLGTTPSLRETRLPFGTHTLLVYHPKLGTKKMTINVTKPEQDVEVSFGR